MSRKTFTIRAEAHELYRCARCRRRLVTGTRVTIVREPGLVVVKHAGRTCPPVFASRPL